MIGRAARCVTLLALATLPGCRQKDPCDVVIYTYVDQIYSEPPIRSFEAATGLKVCATFPSFETKGCGRRAPAPRPRRRAAGGRVLGR